MTDTPTVSAPAHVSMGQIQGFPDGTVIRHEVQHFPSGLHIDTTSPTQGEFVRGDDGVYVWRVD